MTTHTIPVQTHGRYLTSPPGGAPASLMLVGFHGQSETAAIEMAHLERIRGARPWLLVSIQGLHRYYTRRGDVVAAWMTREDRELAMADNVAYVRAVVDEVRQAMADPPPRLVYTGFSQGTAMAYRAAAMGGLRCQGLVILAGDLPPDVAPAAASLPPVLLGRGTLETWYTAEKAAADLTRLRSAGVAATEVVFEGGHERVPAFEASAAAFIESLASGA